MTVTATSPALLVPEIVAVTDAEGAYALRDLPVGLYQLTYELSGFQRLVRDQVQLNAGFSATLNATMGIGAVAETVIVSGQSPVVDTTSTSTKSSLSSETLTNVIPAVRNLQEFLTTTPGISPAAKADQSGGTIGNYTGYGVVGQLTMLVDGVEARNSKDGPGPAADFASLEEVQVVTSGGGAEQAMPGVFVSLIAKSGGNQFSGRYETQGALAKFQGNNLTPALIAQGLSNGDGIKYASESTGDLGGRIVKDKLWFYVAGRLERDARNPLGLSEATGPDGRYNTADDVPATLQNRMDNETVKITNQVSKSYKLIGFYTRNHYYSRPSPNRITRTVPLESSETRENAPTVVKFEVQGTPSNRLVFSVLGASNFTNNKTFQDPLGGNRPFTLDNTTLQQTGPTNNMKSEHRKNSQLRGSATFFPESSFLGRHELKGGFSLTRQYFQGGQLNNPHGNYRLIFDTVAGVPHQAFQITTFNYPVTPRSDLIENGLYAQDTWRVGDRISVNLGLRWDTFDTFVPAAEKAAGQFAVAGSFPKIETGAWRPLAPRIGISYDLAGNGKTVLKASYGRYNHTPGDDFAQTYNTTTGIVSTTYRWRDLNGNADYDPGEVNLNNNGPDFVSISTGTPIALNPNLKDPFTREAGLSVERELRPNLGMRVSYTYLRQSDLIETVNVLRPLSAWNVPLQRQDPGPDGVTGTGDDGGVLTIYDYDPAFRGSAFVGNQAVNRPRDRDHSRKTIEAVLTRRTVGKWGLLGGVTVQRVHNWVVGVPQSPNDDINNAYQTWEWQAKVTGNYHLPWRIDFSATAQAFNGVQLQRTFLFRNLASASTATVKLEPLASRLGPRRSMVNLRLAKELAGLGRGRVRLSLDVLNALNRASQWQISSVSGPTFGQVSTIDSPRLLRGSLSYSF